MTSSSENQIRTVIQASIDAKQQLLDGPHIAIIADMAQDIAEAIQKGGKLLLCGNGGSAADAQHLAAELLIRLRSDVNRQGLPALTLATDTSTLTACGNDFSYEAIFERPLRALGKNGDVLLAISTSGHSENIVRALKAAQGMDIKALGFLGKDGGPALGACDLALVAPSYDTGRIQEIHITLGHALMACIEDLLLESGYIEKL